MTPSSATAPTWAPVLAAALAEALPRLHGAADDPLIGELIGALSDALARGELELDLAGPAPEAIHSEGWPDAHRRSLVQSPLAAEPEGPLVLVGGQRLLWRLWQQQRQRVLTHLVARAQTTPASKQPAAAPASSSLKSPPRAPATPAEPRSTLDGRQQQAVQAVGGHGLVLLEGGPGTGKTSTVAAMIAGAQAVAPELRIHLAAPTGKAAARLRGATGGQLPCTTLHRLLESRGGHFARDRRRPLELDLLVVDEVSMVDLALMEALLDALPPACRLVLVGDPAQLPPIAPGAVLLALQEPHWRQQLAGAIVTLTTTYRNNGAIAAVATALRSGLGDGTTEGASTLATVPAGGVAADADPIAPIRDQLAVLGPTDNLRWIEARPPQLPQELIAALRLHQQQLRQLAQGCVPEDRDTQAALLALRDGLLVLTPVRQGPWGLEAIHRSLLGEQLDRPPLDWPAGTPVLCTRNLPELGLANGDVGILIGSAADPGQRRIVFGSPGLEIAPIHPAQLAGAAEPALALTVHKAQGSEARQLIVLLPPGRTDHRLLYTALTRAREQALLITSPLPQKTTGERGEARSSR
ncbi:MAG: AAA family ATPase [Synechococcaceae cyanobacterium ELA739]